MGVYGLVLGTTCDEQPAKRVGRASVGRGQAPNRAFKSSQYGIWAEDLSKTGASMPAHVARSSVRQLRRQHDRVPADAALRSRAVEAVLQNRPCTLLNILESNPEMSFRLWQEILTAVTAANDIHTSDFLYTIYNFLSTRHLDYTLNDPIDADYNRAANWAALYGDTFKIKAFKRYGANFGLPNRLGTTPLFDAVRGRSPEAIECIIQVAGRDELYRFNNYDCSPMHWACMHCSMPGAQGLHELEPGLINAPNKNGGLALDLLDWRKLYHAEAVERTFGRAPKADELRPYEELGDWMRANGARHSRAWAVLPDREKLKGGRAPFNAEPWWNYVRRPLGWDAA